MSFGLVVVLLAAAAQPPGVTFGELVRRAMERDPERAIAEAELRSARSAEDLAHWTRWSPSLTATGAFGVVPAARGNIFSSPDTPRDLNNFGPFWRGRIDFSWPIFSFGRLSSAEHAAHSAVASKEAKAQERYAAAADLCARAYFGYLLSRENLSLIAEVREHLDRHIAALEKAEDTEPLDLYRVRSYGFQLDHLESEARQGLAEAELGLHLLSGSEVAPAADHLRPLPDNAGDLDVERAIDASPERREAILGAEAKAALARSESERWPVLAIDGRFEYGRAPNRDRQDNPFVYEPFNVRSLGATFALKWDINFKQTNARAARAQADADALKEKAAALTLKLRFDRGRDKARLEEARRMYETSRRALGTTGNWLKVAEENHELGTASTRDVVDAYAAYLQARGTHLRAIHDLNLALIAWRSALGQPLPVETP
jgi:outer membrane protein